MTSYGTAEIPYRLVDLYCDIKLERKNNQVISNKSEILFNFKNKNKYLPISPRFFQSPNNHQKRYSLGLVYEHSNREWHSTYNS